MYNHKVSEPNKILITIMILVSVMKNYLIYSLFLLFSCSKTAPKIEQDYSLPETWDGAVLVKDFQQKTCNEDMIAVTDTPPKAFAKVSNGNITISYPLAHFRCDQLVEALARKTDNEVAHPYPTGGNEPSLCGEV